MEQTTDLDNQVSQVLGPERRNLDFAQINRIFWSWRRTVAGRPFTLVAGLTYDALSQDRLAFENFVGETLGVRGNLRRDEVNDIDNLDQYIQLSVDPHPRWNLMAGVRRSKVEFDSDDRYIVGPNGDDSGTADFSETTPVAGAL